ncbi:MAG: anaerobic ribonucleoside-triphosphate reductase activating protein [Bacteroidales bacterium]|nr:anaerobic ribonucleoside-triphosphate reductase activating protein [Bacteroidales bacterium]
MRILDIIRGTTVDGEGFRTAIYMAGCNHHCPGCHNPGSWDFEGGRDMSLEEIMEIVDEEEFDVTLSGGDPFCNVDDSLRLAREIRKRGYNIWCYTGYTIEEIRNDPALAPLLEEINVLVDGPFIRDLHDPDLLFRGSSNQRIIRL